METFEDPILRILQPLESLEPAQGFSFGNCSSGLVRGPHP